MSSVREHLKIMVSLQKREVEISRLERDLASIDERINLLNNELESYQNAVKDQEENLSDISASYRSNEDDIKMIEAQVIKSKEKLSAVKTNKEYQSMLKEIDELNERSSQLEDTMLSDLERMEALEGTLSECKADLKDAQYDINQKQEEIRLKSAKEEEVLELLKTERHDIWETLEEKLQGTYQNVKRQGHGIVVAPILDGICQVCRINIPPQLFNEVMRMDSMRMCPNCQRIMYPKAVVEEES